jgi:hypothetical protein
MKVHYTTDIRLYFRHYFLFCDTARSKSPNPTIHNPIMKIGSKYLISEALGERSPPPPPPHRPRPPAVATNEKLVAAFK